MKRITREWIDKAEGDFSTMMRESRVRNNPNHEAAVDARQRCRTFRNSARTSLLNE
ncbi:MAG: hypothetical protein U9N73_12140 [Candidatus Auribacterota bacterium]|nr:hypothetical protein [Candidatus Auribacterota bacterium]